MTDNTDNSLDQFINYIIIEQPKWFVAGDFIERAVLLSKYVELYGGSSYGFFKATKNRLWSIEKRMVVNKTKTKNRAVFLKLLKFDKIE